MSLCEPPGAASVEIALIGPAERRSAAREVLHELVAGRVSVQWSELEDADVGASIRLAAVEDLSLAHVHVDLRGAPLLVYIGDRGHVRVLIRRVALPANFDEAAREEVGAIVSSALDALCAGGTIGIARMQAPTGPAPVVRVEPAPVIRATASRRRGGGVLARYRVMGWSPTRVQHVLELGGVVGRYGGRVDPQAIAWVGAIPPGSWATSSPRVGGVVLRAELGAVIRLAPRWSQLVSAGAGVDLLRGADGRARWTGVPMVQASLGLRMELGRGVVAEVQAHAAVDLVDTRVIDVVDGRVLFDPWRVRPGLSLALGWQKQL